MNKLDAFNKDKRKCKKCKEYYDYCDVGEHYLIKPICEGCNKKWELFWTKAIPPNRTVLSTGKQRDRNFDDWCNNEQT